MKPKKTSKKNVFFFKKQASFFLFTSLAKAPAEWSSSRLPSDTSPLHKPSAFPSGSRVADVGSFEKNVLPYQSATSGKSHKSSPSSRRSSTSSTTTSASRLEEAKVKLELERLQRVQNQERMQKEEEIQNFKAKMKR